MFIELFNTLAVYTIYGEKLIKLSQDHKFEITIPKSTPEQVLNKCSKCISCTCKRSSEEMFAFCNYLAM